LAKKKKERVLTEKELGRQKNIEKITDDLAKQGYVRKDNTVSIVLANVMAIVLSIPFIVLFCVCFFVRNNSIITSIPL